MLIPELLQEAVKQSVLWSKVDRERRERVWKTVDRINARLGRGTLRVLSARTKDAVRQLAEHRSLR